MIEFWTFGLGLLIGAVGSAIIVVGPQTKKDKAQNVPFHRWWIVDNLWVKTILDPFSFYYNEHKTNISIKDSYIEGGCGKTRCRKIFINDKFCAAVVQIRDSQESYYTDYVVEGYIETEVWNVVEVADKALKEFRVAKQHGVSLFEEEQE